ncbi:hypothetical protein [Spongorhabdus nitratireducens]
MPGGAAIQADSFLHVNVAARKLQEELGLNFGLGDLINLNRSYTHNNHTVYVMGDKTSRGLFFLSGTRLPAEGYRYPERFDAPRLRVTVQNRLVDLADTPQNRPFRRIADIRLLKLKVIREWLEANNILDAERFPEGQPVLIPDPEHAAAPLAVQYDFLMTIQQGLMIESPTCSASCMFSLMDNPEIRAVTDEQLAGFFPPEPVEPLPDEIVVQRNDAPEIVPPVVPQPLIAPVIDVPAPQRVVIPAVEQNPVRRREERVVPPPVVADVDPVIPPRSRYAMPVAFDGWPEVDVRQLLPLLDNPPEGYIGMTDYGALFYLPRFSDRYIDDVFRFHQAMNAIIQDHLIPIKDFWPEQFSQDLLLPVNIREANIQSIINLIEVINSNDVASEVFKLMKPVNQNVRKRYLRTEGKVMVVGCGANHDRHVNFHPAAHTFTIDPSREMGADLVSDVQYGFHMLPKKEHFSVIYFESVPSMLFEYGELNRAMLKKAYDLLKPDGLLMIRAGCATMCTYDDYNVPEMMTGLLNEAGFLEVKFIEDEISDMFGRLYHLRNDFKFSANKLWNRVVNEGYIPVSRDEAIRKGIKVISIKK